MENKFIDLSIEESIKSLKTNDIPVGAVIVSRGTLIAKAHNTKNKTKDVTDHAEIIAIKKACKRLKSWHLDNCELYVTLEPCAMCKGAIAESRIKKVYYVMSSEYHKCELQKINMKKVTCNKRYKNIVNDFFLNLRKKQ